MRAAAIVFDLDGTLADTLSDIGASMNRALARLGLATHTLEAYRGFVGEGVAVLARKAAAGAPEDLLEELLRSFREDYSQHLLDTTVPYEGTVELLSDLALRRVPASVLSNKPQAATERVVRALFPRVPFVRVAGQHPDMPRKPDPTQALSLVLAMGVEPASCALVGDSMIDMQTATRAGMIAIGVTWGFRSPDELRTHGAQALVSHPRELLGLVA